MRIGAFCTLIPHIYYGVGYCVVYLLLGLSTTFCWINESQLHTFFFITKINLLELRMIDPYYDQSKFAWGLCKRIP